MLTRYRRAGVILLSVLTLVALAVYAPRAWSSYQRWKLKKLGLEQLQAVVRADSGNLAARHELALAYARGDRQQEAVRELLGVLQVDPTQAEVLNDLGVCYLLQQRYYESLVALRGAVTVKPDFAAAWANLGRLHMATKMPFTAVRELERAVQISPRDADTLCDLGEAYQRTLNLNSAEAVYRRALKVRPGSTAARLGLGKAYYSLARYDAAKEELTKVLADEPENPGALLTLARLQLEQAGSPSELETVRALVEKGARADPQDPEAWYDLGRVELRLRRPEEAAEALRTALRLSPEHPGAMYQLSRALRAGGKTAEADRVVAVFRDLSLRSREEARLEEHVHRNPKDWDARARLAEIYLQSGERGLAALMCRDLQYGKPDHPRLPGLLKSLETVQASAGAGSPGLPGAGSGSFPLRYERNAGAR
jgi:cytochrome c-type biogenesis protein CcmH/NrfG